MIHPNVRSSLSATSTMVRIQHFLSFIVAVLPAFNASISEIISVSRPSPAANFILIFQSSHRLPFSYALHPRPFSQSHTFDVHIKQGAMTDVFWNAVKCHFHRFWGNQYHINVLMVFCLLCLAHNFVQEALWKAPTLRINVRKRSCFPFIFQS